MPILNEDDIAIYAPSLVSLIGTDELNGLLVYTQSVIESPLGCNRPIELTEFTENINYIHSTTRENTVYLTYFPIDLLVIPVFEVRLSAHPVQVDYSRFSSQYYAETAYPYYRSDVLNEYETLAVTDYTLYQNGELVIHKPNIVRDLRSTYTAGLDFSATTQDINSFKSAFGYLLTFLYSAPVYSGITEVEVPFDEYKIRYNNSSAPYTIPPTLLSFFKKYCPRSSPF